MTASPIGPYRGQDDAKAKPEYRITYPNNIEFNWISRYEEIMVNCLSRIVMACGLVIVVFMHAAMTPAVAVAQQSDPNAKQTDAKQADAKATDASDKGSAETKKLNDKAAKTPWISLTGQWKACEFGGDGDVTFKDGVIKMDYGDPITGVRWEGPFDSDKKNSDEKQGDKKTAATKKSNRSLPRDNYEIRWQCRRDRGFDFLCAFTFPVADKYASLVMGGWGGGITGISSIDGQDASDNDTTMFLAFDNDQWYSARVRVDQAMITVWVDGTKLFDHPRKGYEFDIRFEMDPCTPLGIANFESDSQIRNIQIRRLHRSEIPTNEKDKH